MSKSTLASHRIYTGKILSLDVDQVRFPDGSTGDMEIVRHPGAAAILPFLSDPAGDDPQIMLLKQYRYASDSYLYEIPAGKLESGEEPRACAERELKEETGCSAQHFEQIFDFYTSPGFSDEKLHVFLASGLTKGEPDREKDEFVTVETMRLSYALKLIQTNEIEDGKTMLAILYAAGFSSGA